MRLDSTVDPVIPYFRCVKPDQSIYSISIEDAFRLRFEGMSGNHSAKIREYVVRLQGELSACKSQVENTE